jgi:hypothetical protein
MKSSQHTRTSGGGVPALAGRVQFQLTRIEIDRVVSCTESDLLVGRRELDLNKEEEVEENHREIEK